MEGSPRHPLNPTGSRSSADPRPRLRWPNHVDEDRSPRGVWAHGDIQVLRLAKYRHTAMAHTAMAATMMRLSASGPFMWFPSVLMR